MALFIHRENQELLWNIISRNPTINNHFVAYPPNVKDNWFKTIVQNLYENNSYRNLSKNDLLELNKATITAMVDNIKRMQPQSPITQQPTSQSYNQNFLSSYSVTENKEEKTASQFNKYQNEYQSMFEKRIPDSVDFSEKVGDGAISNMDELIKNHMRQRDEELKKYSPPPIIQNNTNKIVIDSNPVNITAEIIHDTQEDAKMKKSVSWSDNRSEIDDLRRLVLELSEKISSLSSEIKSIQNHFTPLHTLLPSNPVETTINDMIDKIIDSSNNTIA